MCRVVEGTVRSLNNLIEKLHQSYFLYLLDSPNSFIGYEEYSAALWVIFAPIFLDCLSIYYANEGRNAITALFSVVASGMAGVMILAVPLAIKSFAVASSLSTLQFLMLWFICGAVIAVGLLLFGFPLVKRLCRSFVPTPSNKDGQSDYGTDSVFDPFTVKSFCLMFSGLLVAVLIVIHASIAFVAAVYLYLMSLIANPISTPSRKDKVRGLLRLLILIIASPVHLLWWLFVVHSWVMSANTTQWASSIFSLDKLSSWVDRNLWDLDIYENLLPYVICLVIIPVHLVYLRLVCITHQAVPSKASPTQPSSHK